jgi:hypothetical protein
MPRQLSDTLVRSIALLLALGGYYLLLPHLFESDSGVAIGAGLIAFGAIVVVSAVWGLVDGRRRSFRDLALVWAAVSVVFGLAWAVGLALTGEDSSMSASELFVHDLGLLPFTIGLVVVPAVVGGALGQATAGRTG